MAHAASIQFHMIAVQLVCHVRVKLDRPAITVDFSDTQLGANKATRAYSSAILPV